MQNSESIVFDKRHANIFRVYKSIIAAKYTWPSASQQPQPLVRWPALYGG